MCIGKSRWRGTENNKKGMSQIENRQKEKRDEDLHNSNIMYLLLIFVFVYT